MNSLLNRLGYRLARFLSQADEEQESIATCSRKALEAALQPGDVLLIDGTSRISTAIKYITQSTWSHAAIFISKSPPVTNDSNPNNKPILIEADITEGVHTVPLSRYCQKHTRICRPVELSPKEIEQVIEFMKQKTGYKYDL